MQGLRARRGIGGCSIELRHLAALATVAEQASFSGAADNLGYVQSAVSQQIGALERIVGQRLVNRSARPRSVTVTDAGQTLLDHVDEILTQLRLAKADIDSLTHRSERSVSFGVDTILGSGVTATVTRALLNHGGGLGWERVERGSTDELLQLVAGGELDAAFVPLPIAAGHFYALESLRASRTCWSHRQERSEGRRPPLPFSLACPWCESKDAPPQLRCLAVEVGRPRGTPLAGRRPRSHWCAREPLARRPTRDVSQEDAELRTYRVPELPVINVGIAWHRDQDASPTVHALRVAARHGFGPRRA